MNDNATVGIGSHDGFEARCPRPGSWLGHPPSGAWAQQAQSPKREAAFSHQIVTRDGERIARSIATRRDSEAGKRALAAVGANYRDIGLRHLAEGRDLRAAVRALSLAVAGDSKDHAAWLGLARAYVGIVPDPTRPSERYDLPASASGAAWRAYETASDAPSRAAALAVLTEALTRRSMWNPAIAAMKASVALSATPESEKRLAELRATHGFRVVDYKIDSDAASPRLCVNFSEPLAKAAPESLARFATLDGREPESLSGEGNQMCVDGLKHGQRYALQVRAGLMAASGESLSKASEIAVYVRDRTPSVRLQGRAYVLPSRGQQGIPVTTVNTRTLKVEIYRVADRSLGLAAGSDSFLKGMEHWDLERVRERSGQRVWSGQLDVADRLNQDVTTAIPVSEALKAPAPGVYIVSTEIETKSGGNSGLKRAAQWFVISDLGLTAFTGPQGLDGFVRSLSATTAVGGVKVRLVARNNEVLGTATTDNDGHVHFDAGLLKGEASLSPRLLIAEGQNDYALLDLASAAFDLSDRGVKGRAAPGPLDGFLYAERGVYRPGETVHLTGLVRTRSAQASDVAATLIVMRPDGVEHRRVVVPDLGLGGRTHDLALATTAMSGTWRVRLHADPKSPALAETAFLVEDFVPERLAMTLDPQSETLSTNAPGTIALKGRYLYGPPAADLGLEGEVIVRAAQHGVVGYPGYRFGIAGETFPQVRAALENLGTTGKDGTASVEVQLPVIKATATPLEASVMVRLREAAGRAIERRVTLPVAGQSPRIGIKPLFADSRLGAGDDAGFDVVAIDASGKALGGQTLKWEIVRLDQRWQWYAHDGAWRYEPITTTRRMSTGEVTANADAPQRITFKADWGRYRLDITGADGLHSSVLFQAGWSGGDSIDSPEVLDVALDKSGYAAGETARLKITSREAGRALVTVLGEGVALSREVDVAKGGAEVALPVDAKWMPGVYVAATLYRSLDEAAKRMPGRAVGIAWLGLDTKPRTLGVKMELPEKALPGKPLTVPVKLTGLKAGEEARITLAAVDVGILALTGYKAPAPEDWFYAQRRLGIEMRDLYGRLIDGMRAERGAMRSGGDGNGGMSAEGSPPVEKPLSLFSGIVKVGQDGTATTTFDIPDFNGQVRVMAVAWSGDKVGSASQEVTVRDRVALTATAPRFLTLGDEARLTIDVHNIDGPEAAYRVGVTRDGGGGGQVLPDHDLTLKPSERAQHIVALKPSDLGDTTYAIRVTGPDGIEVRRQLSLTVKAPAAGIRRSTVSALAPGKSLSVSKDLFHDLIPSSARMTLTVGPTAAFDVAGLFAQLDKYPYGCAEQTTSRALPLLYLSDLARGLGMAEAAEIKSRIAKAIDRLGDMQDSTGAFGIWGPTDGDLWLTAYVTDFLTRAKEQGFTVRPETLTQALDRLANHLAYAQDFTRGGEDRAYALYVLARSGKAPVGDLRYYVDARLDRFATPLAKAQLGAALAMLGDRTRAGRAFEAALKDFEAQNGQPVADYRDDYGSMVRDGAGILTLAAETRMLAPRQADLTRVLATAFRQRTHTSTQEQAWMLLAARALSEEAKATRLTVGGKTVQGELTRLLLPKDLANGDLQVVNAGTSGIDAVVSVTGASLTPEPAIAKGFTIERAYYTLDGTKVDLTSAGGSAATIAQNTRLVAVVTIKGDKPGGRILLVDRLPAGLEVENPRLIDSGDVKSLAWLQRGRTPQHTDFRDDRVVAAFSFFGDRQPSGAKAESVTASVAYIVRAVTPGTYVHPAATVEDMYVPERFARTDAGRLTVTETK
ncbi:MAG: alpha-2-macroglobulin [Hyphomicrobiaceae bacterium]